MSKELDNYFEFKCRKGFKALELSGEKYNERLDYEITCIKKMGFPGYMLIVQDLLNWATRNDILTGVARGSAAGSLVCYVLGITKIDPIKHGLIFERFLNPDRVSLPDIDMDFEIDRREEVVDYVKTVYGVDKVARITTFSEMQAKGAIRDVGRAMDLPYIDGDRMSKALIDGSIKENMSNNPDFANILDENDKFKEVADLAARLEGNVRNSGQHAAGVVIGDKPLNEYMPVYTSRKTGDNLTQFAMNEVEEVGLIKFDFLGLKNLSIVHLAQKLIKDNHGIEVDLDELTNTLDDKKVYELFANGDTTNIFQFESGGMKKYLKKLNPTCFNDIVALNALYRPGPLHSGMMDDFIERKNDPTKIKYLHPDLEPHLKDTYGLFIFQEGLMKVCEVLGGYTLSEADFIRKCCGKKLDKELKKERPKFIRGCVKKGLSKNDADKLFDDIENFGFYSFNKSHSAAYSVIAYWTAWFKVYYPLEYMTAVLSYEMDNKEDLFTYVNEAKKMGIEFLPPDINKSMPKFSIEDGKIRYALSAIECIGLETSEELVEKRKSRGDFFSIRGIVELTNSKKVTSQVIEMLIKSGAMDSFETPKEYMLALVEPAMAFKKKKNLRDKKHQLMLFERVLDLKDFELDNYVKPSKSERDQYESDALGFYLFDNPLQDHEETINQHATHTLSQIKEGEVAKEDHKHIVVGGYIASVKRVKRKKDGAPMAFLQLSNGMNDVEVCVFTRDYSRLDSMINKNAIILFRGRFSNSETGGQVVAKGATLINDLPKLKTNKSFFNIVTENGDRFIFETKEKLNYLPKLTKTFKNYKEGTN